MMHLPPEPWLTLLGADPRPWLLDSAEPATRWIALTALLDRPEDDPEVIAARRGVLADPGTQALIARLPDWETAPVRGHNRPDFAPNLLHLLADMGVRGGDDGRIEALLDALLAHQEPTGRFASFGIAHGGQTAEWGSVLCDSHAIIEALVRYGRGDDPRTAAGIARMAADLTDTAQGRAWLCVPHAVSKWRGPGRKSECCPQVSLEALRSFARLPAAQRPPDVLVAAATSLRAWRVRGEEKPYMFGHGRQFKQVKWPAFWYDAHGALDTLGRYPELWRSPDARPEDRRSLAELAACLIAYNFNPDGTVTPHSCYQGFETYSFGQKKAPSPFATARLCAVLRRFNDLSEEIRAVDVLALGSSKGGTGSPVPPRG
ncbi:MAG: hypothetical protein NT169_07610 [Chloroflexi bacterium]|nr:hypothetical protein [Chloroflexota bacterium]